MKGRNMTNHPTLLILEMMELKLICRTKDAEEIKAKVR
jgi:hypothetical protein